MKRNIVLLTLLLSVTSSLFAFELPTKEEIQEKITKKSLLTAGAVIGTVLVFGSGYVLVQYLRSPKGPKVVVTPPAKGKGFTPPPSPRAHRRKAQKGDTIRPPKAE